MDNCTIFFKKGVYNEVQNGPMSSTWDHNGNSSSAVENIIPEDKNIQVNSQKIPYWAAYNSDIKAQTSSRYTDHSYSLPIINAPAHEWSTLVTALDQTHKLNCKVNCIKATQTCVWLDMDLYKRAVK